MVLVVACDVTFCGLLCSVMKLFKSLTFRSRIQFASVLHSGEMMFPIITWTPHTHSVTSSLISVPDFDTSC